MDVYQLIQSLEQWDGLFRRKRETLLERAHPILSPAGLAAALVGIRRCGKTSLAMVMSREVAPERVLYYNFEDPLFIDEKGPQHLNTLLDAGHQFRKGPIELLILDEIHNVPGWERWVRTIVDQGRFRCIITGSSAKLLSSEIGSSLTGRCLQHTVWPLSYREFIDFSSSKPDDRRSHLSVFSRYLEWGGMPEVIQRIDAGISENLLDQYISDILLKDVVQRHEIRNTRLLRQLATFYFTNISSLHSYSSLAKAFSAGTDTVMLYTQAMQEAFLLFEVERYHPNLKSQARDPRKLYAIDLGLRRAIARSPQVDSGKALENVVYLELRRRGLEVMYYKGNQEVDFLVLDRYQPIEAIQVCASLSGAPDTRRREVQALTECMKALNLSRGTIIALNEDETIKVEGLTISVVSAWRWLWEGGIQGEARQLLG